MDWFFNWIGWSILGFVLLALELVLPGVFIMWWGFASLILAFIVAFFTLGQALQIVLFAIIATIFSLIWWKYQHGKDKKEDQNSSLNSREHAMLGAQGFVVEILPNGIARGKFGDTTWRVIGNNLQVADKIEVQKVEGITLFVRKQ
ncbi:TPA: NfeD family protein [Mannheimia haemolytica]